MESDQSAPLPSPSASPSAPLPSSPPSPADESIDIELFSKVQLRIGEIREAESVPKSKKLLRLQVDLGPDMGTRQILSGIAQYYDPTTLIGRRIIVVANLKPAMMMGLESRGMLLAASSSDGAMLAIVEPDPLLPLGSVVR